MALGFFGLTSNNAPLVRKNLFQSLHAIVFHGKGGYDLHTIYNLPIWLRKFITSEIQEHYKKEKESIEKAKKGKGEKTLISSDGKINTPEFIKASKEYKGKTSYK